MQWESDQKLREQEGEIIHLTRSLEQTQSQNEQSLTKAQEEIEASYKLRLDRKEQQLSTLRNMTESEKQEFESQITKLTKQNSDQKTVISDLKSSLEEMRLEKE